MAEGYKFPPLKWLMAFEAAARHMSFTAAAEELGLSQAAISYQIKCLEGMVGAPLFERKPRNLQLTEIGHAYLPSIRRAFDELFSSTAGLFGHVGQNIVTIRVAISFMTLCLGPRMNEFHRLHPDININFWSSIWGNSENSLDADLDIRIGHGDWPGYKVTLLSEETSILVSNRENAGKIRAVQDLAHIPVQQMILVDGQEDLWRRALRDVGAPPLTEGGFRVDTTLAAAELVGAGVGYAFISKLLAKPYLDSGKLVAPLDMELKMNRAHYLLEPLAHQRPAPEVFILRDWLKNLDWTK